MKRIVFILLIAFASFQSISAQTNESGRRFEIGCFASAGFQILDLEELNNRFVEYGYASFSEEAIAYAGGIYFGNRDYIFTSLGIYSFSDAKSNNTFTETKLTAFGLNFDVNYTILKTEKLFLYPMAGISANVISIMINDKSGTGQSFNNSIEVLNGERVIYTNPLLLFNFGIAMNRIILRSRNDLGIGLQLGYRIDFSETQWGVSGFEVSDGPNIKAGGFYANLVLNLF